MKNSKSKSSKSRNTKAKSRTNTTRTSQGIDRMKYEIASEFGVNLGPESSSRSNGKVGGEITKRLVESGMNKTRNKYNNKK